MSDNKSNVKTLQLHTLCPLCISFWERATCLGFQPEELLTGGKDIPSMPQHVLFSPNRTNILSAASQGCHFCSIIVGVVAGCTGDHGDRQFSGDENFPIYISIVDPEKIRLVEAKNSPSEEYCALSYSWGFSKPYVMTSSNMEAFKQEIHVQDLPRLLQDSIQVVRGLGFRYLWIDALCIMQNGNESSTASDDWVDQAGKMNDIFGNAAVTIAAAECFDGNSSMIVPRNPLSQLTCRLDVSTKFRYEVVPSCTPYCLSHPFDKARYHLDTRAWVFQERILSPRTVHLTRNFVHLECRTELFCGAMDGPDACHHSGAMAKADYQVLFSMFGPTGLDDSAHDAFLSFWHELIRRYSTTNLSRKSDLLVALAGLAKQVQTKSQLTWSFGLWREHLHRDMLWYVRGGRGTSCRERSPSWSWASIDVQGPQIIYDPAAKVSLLADIVNLPDATDFVSRGSMVDEKKHYVKVSGLLRPGVPDSTKYGPNIASSTNNDIVTHRNCQGMKHIHRKCPFHPDYELEENIEMYCLLMACVSGTQQRLSSQSSDTHVGIVLTPVPGCEHRYRRVGYFHIDIQETDDEDQKTPWILEGSNVADIEIV
ncbi:tol [Fusarium beomiforme]|uniref:Tol n=1 Tax=Fusarium beomiforme TaxID=44412 RepID=A0A9P5ATF7_9HYPO|nr:tol [Fusarium beomiforme]